MRSRRGLLWAAALVVMPCGCGARSELLQAPPPGAGGAAGSAGAGDDAGDPCAPPPRVNAACAPAIAAAAPGAEVWMTIIDTGSNDLLGPVAADGAGDTFYLAADQGLYVKTVYALGPCGTLRWQADVASLVAASGYVPQVMLAGGHLLLVGIGSIVALDARTGAHAWTAELTAFAQGGGLGVAPGKVVGMGFTAARADGTAFTAVANDRDAWIVAVDVHGKPRAVAKVDNYLSGAGYPLGAQQMAIDAAGHVVLAGGYNPGAADRIDAFSAAGTSAYSTVLPAWGVGQGLTAGAGFVTGRGLWLLDAAGALQNSFVGGGPTFISYDGPIVVDADNRLYAVGGQHVDPGSSAVTYNLLGSFSPDGAQRWSVTLEEPVVSGPVLGDNDELFVVTSAGSDVGSPQHMEGRALADGTRSWRVDLPPSGKRPSYWMLLGAAGTLMIVIDHAVQAYACGGALPPACAWWPTPHGAPDQRVCAFGK